MKKILITGASGFIGRHIVIALGAREDYEVHGVRLGPLAKDLESRCTWHQADILDPDQVEKLFNIVKPSHLLHLAWETTPRIYWNAAANFDWVHASLTIVKQFNKNGGQRLVVAGTCAEYGWNYGYCVEEITPKKPTTIYGQCKNALQNLIAAYCQKNSLSWAKGYVFFVYGPFERPQRFVPAVIMSLLKGKFFTCAAGEQIRDFLYVDDLATAFISLLESELIGPINLASGVPVGVKVVAKRIGEQFNRQELIKFGVLEPQTLDVRRLYNELAWRPLRDLDQGLEETIFWWRNQIEGGR